MLNKRIAGTLVLIAGSAAHAQWTPLNLNPPYYWQVYGSVARGGAGTQCVGRALVLGPAVNEYHAALWSITAPSGYSMVDLNPAGAIGSDALATTGTQQVGSARFGSDTHAGLWNGTAASWIDLNPAGATNSSASGVTSGQQVGSSTFGSNTHAGLWHGTAASWVDLNPAGAASSQVNGISGTQQAGYATFGGNTHAGLWNGTAASWVDLNPAGAASSQVNGTSGTQQVGQAAFGSATHAGLWHGTAATWVDLNPVGASSSAAFAISGTTQAGRATFSDGTTWPGVWHGTAASWEPLPLAELPYANEGTEGWALWSESACSSIWSDGNYLYASGYLTRWQEYATVLVPNAVLWSSPLHASCYANCDGSTQSPVLNVQDFACFLNRFAAGDSYANCDGSTGAPVLNVNDFVCFLNRFAAGCP